MHCDHNLPGWRQLLVLSTCFLSALTVAHQGTVKVSLAGFEDFNADLRREAEDFTQELDREFKEYHALMAQEIALHKLELSRRWVDPVITDRHRWVTYYDNDLARTIVDFETNELTLQIPEGVEDYSLIDMWVDAIQTPVSKAMAEDRILQSVRSRLGMGPVEVETDERVLSEIDPEDANQLLEGASIKETVQGDQEHRRRMIEVTVPLSDSRISDKAEAYRPLAEKYGAQFNVDPALILAVMHTESYFNPLARSSVPALGLMQIVPGTAGRDVSKALYGQEMLLSETYLFNPDNNVKAGAAYLDLLQSHYLRDIDDPESRLFAVIAAYNTGAGNVARAFVGARDVAAAVATINELSSEEVYQQLVTHLPYEETRHYVSNVLARAQAYSAADQASL